MSSADAGAGADPGGEDKTNPKRATSDPDMAEREANAKPSGMDADQGPGVDPDVHDIHDAGVEGRLGPEFDAAVQPDPEEEDSESEALLDWLQRLARQNPRTRQSEALLRIARAMANGASSRSIIDALDALDDIGCLQDRQTCARVCQWALSSCDACSADPECLDAIQDSCFLGCP